MHKVLFDCDNTMGVHGRDVDDGLTLMYLLGRNDINLLGVTTTYGNSTIDVVQEATTKLFRDLTISSIPLLKGAGDRTNRDSEAAKFLVDTVNKHPNEIVLLATGSLTNLYGAYNIDKGFFRKVKEIVLMGGITEPLIINGKNLDELNFSCDPEATYTVLSSEAKVTVLTGHICLQAFFGEREFERLMNDDSIVSYKYIKDKAYDWYMFIMQEFCINEFYNWDVVAAMYITNPDLFDENIKLISSTPKDLSTGLLKIGSGNESYKVNIPTTIKDIDLFNETIFNSWKNLKM